MLSGSPLEILGLAKERSWLREWEISLFWHKKPAFPCLPGFLRGERLDSQKHAGFAAHRIVTYRQNTQERGRLTPPANLI